MFNRSSLIAKTTTIAAFFAAMYLTSNAASAASTSYIIPPRVPAAVGGTSPDIGLCLKYNTTPVWARGLREPAGLGAGAHWRVLPAEDPVSSAPGPSFSVKIDYDIHNMHYVRSYNFASHFLKNVVIVPIGPNGTGVLTTKGTSWNIVGTLALPASSGLSATAVAVNSKTQTTYVSVSNTARIGTGRGAGVLPRRRDDADGRAQRSRCRLDGGRRGRR